MAKSGRGGKIGASSSGAGGGEKIVFSPANSDETSRKLSSAASLKLSRSTITMKNENGKTIGMVRGLERFSDMQGGKQFTAAQEVRKAGVGGEGIERSDIFFDGKQIYVLNNIKHSEFLSGLSKERAEVMKDEIERVKKKNQRLAEMEKNGVIIVNYRS